MTKEALAAEIRSCCIAHADEKRVLSFQRYFTEPFTGYGLTTSQITSKVKALLDQEDLPLSTIADTVPLLMESGMYEETSFGLLLIAGKKHAYTQELFAVIATWFSLGITNWAHADTMGMYVLHEFFNRRIVELDAFNPWTASPYQYQRRCVPVTLIKVLQTYPVQQLLACIQPLMLDEQRLVNQGTGWFLREAWKVEPEIIEEFLLQWKDRTPRVVIQYACEKMSREAKQRFKKHSR